MAELRDRLALIFNPLFIVGIPRLYQVLDHQLVSAHTPAEAMMRAGQPAFHIPFFCILFTLGSSVLAHEANRKFVDSQQSVDSRSAVAMLTYATSGAILLMYVFSAQIETTSLWLMSYLLLLALNAAWNLLAVPAGRRLPHVVVNATLGTIIVVYLWMVGFSIPTAWAFYSLLVAVTVMKLWQRRQPRW